MSNQENEVSVPLCTAERCSTMDSMHYHIPLGKTEYLFVYNPEPTILSFTMQGWHPFKKTCWERDQFVLVKECLSDECPLPKDSGHHAHINTGRFVYPEEDYLMRWASGEGVMRITEDEHAPGPYGFNKPPEYPDHTMVYLPEHTPNAFSRASEIPIDQYSWSTDGLDKYMLIVRRTKGDRDRDAADIGGRMGDYVIMNSWSNPAEHIFIVEKQDE